MNKYLRQYIESVCKNIDIYLVMRVNKRQPKKIFMALCGDVANVMLEWTGCTYVGQRKDSETEEMYQKFWLSVKNFIDMLSTSKIKQSKIEKAFLQSIIYRGEVYRYLGYPSPNQRKAIEPKYKDVYVSWSKNKGNTYLLTKLYGNRTLLSCIINAPYYGMDLESFNRFYNSNSRKKKYIAKGDEKEVVFPTKKDSIYKIEII